MTTVLEYRRPSRRRLAVLATALFIGCLAPAAAQDAATVVATVNGETIADADLALAATEFGDQLNQIAPAARRQALIDLLINIRLADKAAVAAGLDKDPGVASRLDLMRQRTLYTEYLRKQFAASATEAEVRKRYDEQMAKFVPGDQVRASHILVKTEDEAKAIIAELDKGGDFAAIAKEKSLDPGSGARGGDLGFFGKGMMVKPFEDAAFSTPVGTYTKTPVKSDFGWHIIKVEEARKEPTPTFESVAQAIQQDLIRETFEKTIEGLRATATIEVVPPPAPPPAAAPAPAPATPADPAVPPGDAPATDAPATPPAQ